MNLPDKWTINLYEKNGSWQFYFAYYDLQNKRHQKWVDTDLKIRGNKRKAEAMRQDVIDEWVPKLMQKIGLVSINTTDVPTLVCVNPSIPTDRVLVADYLRTWLIESKVRYQVTTYSEYCRMFDKTIIPFFEQLNLHMDELRTSHVQQFYNGLLKHLSGNSALRVHSYLHKALQDAVDDDERYEYFAINPAHKTKRPQHVKFISEVYSKEDLKRLFGIIGKDFLFLVILMDATYGMRRSELMGLEWNAIDFQRKIVTVKQAAVRCKFDGKYTTIVKPYLKTSSSLRAFKLTPQVEAALLAERERQKQNRKKYGGKTPRFIFVDDLGNLRDPNYVSDHFRRTLKKHGLKVIRFHDLRHTCATMLLDGGIPLKDIQVYLGHSQLATTADIYTHRDFIHQQKTTDIAGEIVQGLQDQNTPEVQI